MKHRIAFILIGLLASFLSLAQPRIALQKPLINKAEKIITLNYSIQEINFNTRKRPIVYEYDVKPFYSEDTAKTFKPMQKVTGDVNNFILKGDNKKIYWTYFDENPDFKGKALYKIDFTFKKSFLGLKGPNAFWYSLILPGWGQSKVNYYETFRARWHFTYLGVLSLFALGYYFNDQSNQAYTKYNNATDVNSTQSAYTSANTNRIFSTTFFALGGALWISDIVRVIIKGKKNKIEQEKIYEKNPELKSTFGMRYHQMTNTPMFVYNLKF